MSQREDDIDQLEIVLHDLLRCAREANELVPSRIDNLHYHRAAGDILGKVRLFVGTVALELGFDSLTGPQEKRIETGIAPLDDTLAAGFEPGNLMTIAGRPEPKGGE